MKYDELVKRITKILPNASFGDDNDGQVVIYTDLRLPMDDKLDELVSCGSDD